MRAEDVSGAGLGKIRVRVVRGRSEGQIDGGAERAHNALHDAVDELAGKTWGGVWDLSVGHGAMKAGWANFIPFNSYSSTI